MTTLVDEKKIISIFFAIVFILATYLTYLFDDNWLKSFGIIVLITISFDIVILKINQFRLLSPVPLFVIVSYLFHFGQLIINAFLPQYHFSLVINNYINGSEAVKNAILYSYVIIQLIVINSILFFKKNNANESSCLNLELMSTSKIRALAWFFVITCFPFNLYLNIRALVMSMHSGYLTVLSSLTENGGFMLQFSIFSVIGLTLLLFAYPRKKTLIFLIEIAYLIITMFSGSRIYSMISIVVISVCYMRIDNKISCKKIFFSSVIGIVILNVVNNISRSRLFGNIDFSEILLSSFSLENNIVVKMLEEFGGTIRSVSIVFEQVPFFVPYGEGSTYLKGFAGVFINFGGFLTDAINDAIYIHHLSNIGPIGGSYIGELLFNFGWAGILFTPVIAKIMVVINNGFEKSVSSGKLYMLAFYLMQFYCSLIWVRGYFSVFTRSIVWAGIMIILADMLIHGQNQDGERLFFKEKL